MFIKKVMYIPAMETAAISAMAPMMTIGLLLRTAGFCSRILAAMSLVLLLCAAFSLSSFFKASRIRLIFLPAQVWAL